MPDSNPPAAGHSLTRTRRLARQRALQALYQHQLNPIGAAALVREFFACYADMRKVDAEYFNALIHGVIERQSEIDQHLNEFISVPISRLDPVELQILRMSCFELLQRLDVPKRVILNEAVLLCKRYGAVDGHKFINGVLDQLCRKLRALEQ